MSRFGKTLFGGSPFIRWTVGPIVVAFLLGMTLLVPRWDPRTAAMVGVFYALGVPLLLGLYIPRWSRVCFRIVTAMVFVTYLTYLIVELKAHNWHLVQPRSRGEANPVNALVGLICIGGPCMIYTVSGRFTWKGEDPGEQ